MFFLFLISINTNAPAARIPTETNATIGVLSPVLGLFFDGLAVVFGVAVGFVVAFVDELAVEVAFGFAVAVAVYGVNLVSDSTYIFSPSVKFIRYSSTPFADEFLSFNAIVDFNSPFSV